MAPQKAVTLNVITGFCWLSAVPLSLLILNRYLQASAVISGLTLVLGAIMWIAIGFVNAKKELKTIEQGPKVTTVNFRFGYALKITFALLAAGIGIILMAFCIAYYHPFWIFLVNLVVPFQAAISLTSAIFYWRWQRRNKRNLYIEGGKVYPYPHMNTPNSKETIY
ncbi:MAG: hypothetical protein M1540_04865 [Candidatus Bathyarchaeota archaeon]|nr:hypothetical protein [Candidatus Bathyarchaeota archaeon]